MPTPIQDAVILITGCNRGIGLAYAKAVLDNGCAKLYAAVRTPTSVQPLVDKYGDKVVPLAVDVAKLDTIQAAANAASDANIVINNAGVLCQGGPLDAAADDNFEHEMTVNTLGLIRVARAFAPVLKQNGGGAFVQLNSVASLLAFPPFATYCASKAASYSITLALKQAFAEQGTQVVSVHPGPIETDMGKDAGFEEMGTVEDVAKETLRAIENDIFHVFPDPMAKDIQAGFSQDPLGIVTAAIGE